MESDKVAQIAQLHEKCLAQQWVLSTVLRAFALWPLPALCPPVPPSASVCLLQAHRLSPLPSCLQLRLSFWDVPLLAVDMASSF